jgi:hypothetical protein
MFVNPIKSGHCNYQLRPPQRLSTPPGLSMLFYRGADKSLARPGRKQATATEDFDVHISYL